MLIAELCFENVHKEAQKIEGWLGDVEAKLLFDTVASLNCDGAIVEIGSWCGKSLVYETFAAMANGKMRKIFSIDPFLNSKDEPNGRYEVFLSNIQSFGIADKVTQLKGKSQIVGETFCDDIAFIFIDGFHKYEAVKKDFELFYNKVVDGGFVALHDVCTYKGPTDLVLELAQSASVKLISLTELTVLIQKVSCLSEEDVENNKKVVADIQSRIANCELIV